MGEEDNFQFWGLSLSLKPPITHLHHKPILCKREPQFSTGNYSVFFLKKKNFLIIFYVVLSYTYIYIEKWLIHMKIFPPEVCSVIMIDKRVA